MRELKSDNYIEYLQGWRISADGDFAEFNDGLFRGEVIVGDINGARITLNNENYLRAYDTSNKIRIKLLPNYLIFRASNSENSLCGSLRGSINTDSNPVLEVGGRLFVSTNYAYDPEDPGPTPFPPSGPPDPNYPHIINEGLVCGGGIMSSGNIIPSVTNNYSCGTSSKKWAHVYCTTLHQGDSVFANNMRITEGEGEIPSLIFKNSKGEKIMELFENGKLWTKI